MKRVVMGIVDTPLQADHAVRQLGEVGIAPRDVSVLYPDRHGDHDFGFEAHTKAPEGALMGIGFGAILGATVGLALALAGAIAISDPQLGPVIVALAGASVGAILLGLLGALLGANVPEIEAKFYEGKAALGTILVAVHARTPRDVYLARSVLAGLVATDVVATSEAPLPVGR